jgi:ammonium transporter, Amt family
VERVMKVDDPVGAFSVHGVCGAWGLLATGLFARGDGLINGGGGDLIVAQLTGIVGIGLFVALAAGGMFYAMKAAGILRVSEAEEFEGLDVHEHGAPGYAPDFSASGGMGGVDLVGTASGAGAKAGV